MNNRRKLFTVLVALTALTAVASATVISVGDIEFESNSEFFDGEVVAIQMLADESTEEIETTVESDTISEQITGETEQDVTISITENERGVEYGISDVQNKEDVRNARAVNERGFDNSDEAIEWASNNCAFGEASIDNYILGWSTSLINYEIFCFQTTETVASVGEFREDSTSPRTTFEVTYQLDVDGEPTDTVTLSNTLVEEGDDWDGTSTSIGSNTRIEWLGNFDLGTSPEGTSSGALAAQSNDFSEGWRVINEDRYDEYNQHATHNVGDRLDDWRQGVRTQEQIEDEFNNLALEASSEHTNHPLSEGRIQDSGINDAVLEYSPDSDLIHPNFMMYIDAGDEASDAITVSRTGGVPNIVSTGGDEIPEIGEGRVTMKAQNAGENSGEFEARVASCTDGFDLDDTIRTHQVDAGQTTEFSFVVGFDSQSSDQEVDGACELELQDTTTQTTVTESVGLTGVQESQCEEGEVYPTVDSGDEVIVECSDGSETVIERCGSGQVSSFVEEEWQCVDQDRDEAGLFSTGFTPLQDISNAVSGGLGTIQTVSLLLGGVVTVGATLFTFGLSYTKLFNLFRLDAVTQDLGAAQSIVRIGFASMFALMVGYLVYILATSIWVQVASMFALLGLGYAYLQFGGVIKAFT